MSVKPILVDQIVKNSDSIPNSLIRQASEQCRLLRSIRLVLPDPMAGLLVGCVQKRSELTIFTESAAPASQLRFLAPLIRDALNACSIPGIETVKIRVTQSPKNKTAGPGLHKIPPLEIIDTLRTCGHFTADADLQRSLNQLADTLENQRLKTQSGQSGVKQQS